jgi:hypothetical protein
MISFASMPFNAVVTAAVLSLAITPVAAAAASSGTSAHAHVKVPSHAEHSKALHHSEHSNGHQRHLPSSRHAANMANIGKAAALGHQKVIAAHHAQSVRVGKKRDLDDLFEELSNRGLKPLDIAHDVAAGLWHGNTGSHIKSHIPPAVKNAAQHIASARTHSSGPHHHAAPHAKSAPKPSVAKGKKKRDLAELYNMLVARHLEELLEERDLFDDLD